VLTLKRDCIHPLCAQRVNTHEKLRPQLWEEFPGKILNQAPNVGVQTPGHDPKLKAKCKESTENTPNRAKSENRIVSKTPLAHQKFLTRALTQIGPNG